jgi:hypothetical protein
VAADTLPSASNALGLSIKWRFCCLALRAEQISITTGVDNRVVGGSSRRDALILGSCSEKSTLEFVSVRHPVSSRSFSLYSDTAVMHRKDDFSDHMTLCKPLVSLVGLGDRIALRDWNLEFCRLHRGVEALEFVDSDTSG